MRKNHSLKQDVDSPSLGQTSARTPLALLPWAILVLAALWLIASARPPRNPGAFNLNQAGLMLVSGDGRVKPLDTVARASLMRISGRQTTKLNGETVPAMQWLLDVMVASPRRDHYPIFEINHSDVLGLMGIQQTDQKMFSFEEIRAHAEKLQEQMDLALQVRQDPQRKLNSAQSALVNLATEVGAYLQLAMGQAPYSVPPLAADEEWQPLMVAHQRAAQTGRLNDAAQQLTKILQSYAANDPAAFNSGVAAYNTMLREHFPREFFKARVETLFNHYAPFYKGTVLYFTAFVLGCIALLMFGLGQTALSQALRNGAVMLLILTLVLHTMGIAVRIYLHERPPVTNLYSSAVFIGWAAVALGILVEFVLKRLSVGIIVGGLSGFVTLLIAHFLSLSEGDTMKNVQAVLDTNFWLATHVPTVTIGYSATFLAGLLGAIFIILGVFTTWLNKSIRHDFAKAVYGVVCFAMVMSFVGTVLGGIWADQSWGRFWGWDPKENGAVLIVLLNALILHARWGGMIRERGMMVLAVAGNIVTAWSWFGTNMLGVGLHSYGFMDSAVLAMWAFVFSQLIIISIGCLPLSMWASYAEPAPHSVSAAPADAPADKRRTGPAGTSIKPAQA